MYRVAYATGSRAEYGIVKRYLNKLNNINNIKLDILVTGTHLEEDFGYTRNEIVEDGFDIVYEVPLNLNTSNNSNITKSMSIALENFGKFFDNTKYDLVIILGDRYEMLAVAIAAAMNNQKILHIHGGEKTLGNYDEFIRHSISKMSTFHITSTEEYRKRVIQLGEFPNKVFNLGALGADNALNNIVENYNVSWEKPYFVVLYHPETLTNASAVEQINEVISAVDTFKEDYHLVFIGGNADTHSEDIFKRVFSYCVENNMTYIQNVDNFHFQNIVHNASIYIGNSSSGIIEAPTIGTISINIGDRQKGRITAESTFSVSCSKNEIIKQINYIIKNKNNIEFVNPYYQENALSLYVDKTIEILENHDEELKNFYDIQF